MKLKNLSNLKSNKQTRGLFLKKCYFLLLTNDLVEVIDGVTDGVIIESSDGGRRQSRSNWSEWINRSDNRVRTDSERGTGRREEVIVEIEAFGDGDSAGGSYRTMSHWIHEGIYYGVYGGVSSGASGDWVGSTSCKRIDTWINSSVSYSKWGGVDNGVSSSSFNRISDCSFSYGINDRIDNSFSDWVNNRIDDGFFDGLQDIAGSDSSVFDQISCWVSYDMFSFKGGSFDPFPSGFDNVSGRFGGFAESSTEFTEKVVLLLFGFRRRVNDVGFKPRKKIDEITSAVFHYGLLSAQPILESDEMGSDEGFGVIEATVEAVETGVETVVVGEGVGFEAVDGGVNWGGAD